MTREPIEVTRQDRIYCLKVSSDYHSEVCEECRFYPNCDHMTQDDMTELTIKDLEAIKHCEEVAKELKNLKGKEEPRAVRYEGDGYADGEMVVDYAYCPNCDHETEVDSENWGSMFCPECGQRLRWDE